MKPLVKAVVFLMGPTAIGKTDLAIQLARQFPVDIISVDSAMVYRGLDIGTGKPSEEVLQEIPHRLINLIEPDQVYSVAEFCTAAMLAVEQSHRQNRLPLLVGGTMMYFHALQYGLSRLPGRDPLLRAQLEQDARVLGWERLHQRLCDLDPASGQRIHPNDPQRIERALEINLLTGKTVASASQEKVMFLAAEKYRVYPFAMKINCRSSLHENIAKRFHQMLKAGFIAEVEGLRTRYRSACELPAIACVGYRQIDLHLAGKLDYKTMVEKGIVATRQLAKRQLTWLRQWQNLTELDNKKIIEHINGLSEIG